jgi:hypothetical protein
MMVGYHLGAFCFMLECITERRSKAAWRKVNTDVGKFIGELCEMLVFFNREIIVDCQLQVTRFACLVRN